MAYKALLNNQIFFQTDSNDLVLTSAKLDRAVGTAGSFTFTIPPSNKYYGSFHKIIDFVDVYRDEDLLFSGRVYSITKTFDTQRKIVCEGLLAVFNDSIFRPVTYQGELHGLIRRIIQNHNSQVEEAKQVQVGRLLISNSDCYRAYQNYETSISRLQDLVKSYGGWMRIRRENGINYLDWYDANIDGTTQRINFGENLLDVKQEENADGICTVLIPLGTANDNNVRIDIKSVNDGLDYIEASSEYIQQYGYVVASHIWDDVNYPSILKTKAQQYLNACLTPRKIINITAVDLADAGYDVDAFNVGQKIKVYSAPHDINGEWFDCTQQSLDLLNPAQNKLTLGSEKIGYIKAARSASAEVKSSLERIAATYAPLSILDQSIERATSLITGNLGGYIRLNDSNGDGEPDELLIMDTPDIDTAVKVWRFNNSGLGYSSTGYDGTYGLAMTMDGQIVADYITSGTMNANVIKGGILRGQAGGSYWNLVTGELHIEGQTNVDKSKVFIREPVTPYYEGDLWVTGYNENSAVVGYAIAGKSIVNTIGTSTGIGVIMTCINTRTTGNFESSDWKVVTNYIDGEAVADLEARVDAAEFNIMTQQGEINAKASSEEVGELEHRVDNAELSITGQGARIDALAVSVQTVADKSKTFRSEPVPPYADGDTWITGTESYNAIAGVAIAGQARINWGKDIYVATRSREASESFNRDDWILATKYVSDSQLYSVRQEIRTAEIAIDAANGRIDLKADTTTVTALSTRVQAAEISLQDARVDIRAQQTVSTELSQRIQTAQISVDAQAGILAQVTDTGTVASGSRVDGDKLINFINLTTSGATIHAERIDLEGAVSIISLDDSLKAKVNGALRGNVPIYYRSTSSTKPAKPDSAVTSTAVDSNNTWTLVMPRPKNGCYFYTCNQQTSDSGTTWTTVQAIPNADYTSKWCLSTNSTYIDGGSIYTGTLDANAIKANTTISNHVSATNLDITGGTVKIESYTNPESSFIQLTCSNIYSFYGPRWMGFTLTGASENYLKTYYGLQYAEGSTTTLDRTYVAFQSRIGSTVNNTYFGDRGVWCEFGARIAAIQRYTESGNTYSQVLADRLDTNSDRRLKKDVQLLDAEKSAEFVYAQRPVSYRWTDENGHGGKHHGLIAQEVEATVQNWGIVGESNGFKTLSYIELIPDLIATIQTLNERIKTLEGKA